MKFFATALIFATTFAIKLHQEDRPQEGPTAKDIFDFVNTDGEAGIEAGVIDASEFGRGLQQALDDGEMDQPKVDQLKSKWVEKFGDAKAGSLTFGEFKRFAGFEDNESSDEEN